jgi:hypothetical protein
MGPNVFANLLRGAGTQQQNMYAPEDLESQMDANGLPIQGGFMAALLGQMPQAQGQIKLDMFGQSNNPAMMRRYM